MTEVAKRAIIEAVAAAGIRDIWLVESCIGSALGAGLPFQQVKGSMVVDIGSGTTEIAVLSMGAPIYKRSLKIGGQAMDEEIIQHIRRNYNLVSGEASAEKVKIEIGSAVDGNNMSRTELLGRDISTGLPQRIVVGEHEIVQALSVPLKGILEGIRFAIESIPPELAGDVMENGITLVGGVAALRGISHYLQQRLFIPVQVAENGKNLNILGLAKLYDDFELLKSVSI